MFRSYLRFSFLANVTFVTPVFDVFIPSQTRMDFTAFYCLLPPKQMHFVVHLHGHYPCDVGHILTCIMF